MNEGIGFFNLVSVRILDRFFLIGLGVALVGLIIFIRYLIVSLTISVQRLMHPLPWYSESLAKKYLLAGVFLIISIIGCFWMYSAVLFQRYQPLEKAVVVGTIEITGSSSGAQARFVASYNNFPNTTIVKQLTGNQWAIAGAFYDFPNWFKVIGIRDSHQVLDIISKDIRVVREPEASYIDKLSVKPDGIWRVLYDMQSSFKHGWVSFHLSPLMLNTSGSYEIYAASSGYVVKRIGKKK